jgi:methylglutaconyl-CoA hydratase
LFLTGERFEASQAASIGLVHRVVANGELNAALEMTVEALLAGSPSAQAAIKTLVRRVDGTPPEEIDAYTSELISAIRASEEGREGVAAFLEKRKPRWATEPDA